MKRYADRPAFISSQKENFKHNTKCRPTNPSKGEIGVASKNFLRRNQQ